jgi:hypothetical protein
VDISLGCHAVAYLDFGERLSLAASAPWRVVTKDGIAHGDEDDGQWFGRSKPVDGEARANELLRGQKVVGIELHRDTADLRLLFEGGTRLDFFNNSSGYEGWQASVRAEGKKLTVIGGRLTTR